MFSRHCCWRGAVVDVVVVVFLTLTLLSTRNGKPVVPKPGTHDAARETKWQLPHQAKKEPKKTDQNIDPPKSKW